MFVGLTFFVEIQVSSPNIARRKKVLQKNDHIIRTYESHEARLYAQNGRHEFL